MKNKGKSTSLTCFALSLTDGSTLFSYYYNVLKSIQFFWKVWNNLLFLHSQKFKNNIIIPLVHLNTWFLSILFQNSMSMSILLFHNYFQLNKGWLQSATVLQKLRSSTGLMTCRSAAITWLVLDLPMLLYFNALLRLESSAGLTSTGSAVQMSLDHPWWCLEAFRFKPRL